ncbi:MAG: hypothetical protein NT169_04155 [Chloroflexi bacterium]|nr:hypothetical protein [Chloroflexota bacterium]
MGWLALLLLWLAAWGLTFAGFRRGRLATPWHRDVAALGLLALATLGFFWRVVAGQNWMPADGGDLVSFLFPTYRFAAATLRDGAWPLWNPFLYAGAPHAADIQAGILYPPNLLLFLLWPEFPYSALQGLSIGHIWFAGAGMYLLLARGLRVRRAAALAGALAFMFSDAFIVHFGNLNFNAVASWLPWIFWAYLAGLEAGNWKLAAGSWKLETGSWKRKWQSAIRNLQSAIRNLQSAILSGALLAIATLAGHIQATLFIVLALAVYSALWLWLHRDDFPPVTVSPRHRVTVSVRLLVYLSTCLLVTFLLSAPILLPAFQLTGYTARAAWNYTQTTGYSLAPAQWIGWLIPGFFGRGPQFHWGAWPRVEAGYLGILPLILAGLALALRRNQRTWAWAGLAGTGFILALGIYAIPHGWLTLLPGFGQLRAPARLVLVADFALAALAALGLDAALEPLADRARAAFEKVWRLVAYTTGAVLAVGVPLAYLALLLTQDRDPAIVLRVSITLLAVITFAGLLLASLLWLTARRGGWAKPQTLGWLAAGLILLDVASLGAYQDLGDRDPSRSFDQAKIAAFLQAQPAGPFRIDTRTGIEREWQPDTALLYSLEDVGGLVNPLTLADATRYWDGLESRSSQLYDLLNVRYVIAKKDVTLDWDKFVLAFDGDPKVNVYLNRRALPRAFVVGQAQGVADHEAAWAAIHAPGFDPASLAVIEGAAPAGGGRGAVAEIRSAPGRVTVAATTDGPALLVVSQMWYPGWQVWVDGRPQGAPLRVDYAFQGVPLPTGTHEIELRFAPSLWRWGWVLAGVAAAGLLAALVISANLQDWRFPIQ